MEKIEKLLKETFKTFEYIRKTDNFYIYKVVYETSIWGEDISKNRIKFLDAITKINLKYKNIFVSPKK